MKQTFFIGAVVAVVIATIFIYVPREDPLPQTISVLSPASTTTSSPTNTHPDTEPAMVIAGTPSPATTTTISASRATLKVGDATYSVIVLPGETIIDAMRTLASAGNFAYTSRDYTGLGEFVDSINGIKNAGGMYWMLYVNGVSASSGASVMVVNVGDVAEWKYEKSY